MKDKIPPRKSVETRIITHRDRCDETSPHVFHRPRDGGWFEIEGCLSWRGSTDVVDVAFPVQGRGENLWMGRMSKEVRRIGVRWSATWRIKGSAHYRFDLGWPGSVYRAGCVPLDSINPTTHEHAFKHPCCALCIRGRVCTCGAAVGRTGARPMPRQIGEPRCPPREGETLVRVDWISDPTIRFVGTGSREGDRGEESKSKLNSSFDSTLI